MIWKICRDRNNNQGPLGEWGPCRPRYAGAGRSVNRVWRGTWFGPRGCDMFLMISKYDPFSANWDASTTVESPNNCHRYRPEKISNNEEKWRQHVAIWFLNEPLKLLAAPLLAMHHCYFRPFAWRLSGQTAIFYLATSPFVLPIFEFSDKMRTPEAAGAETRALTFAQITQRNAFSFQALFQLHFLLPPSVLSFVETLWFHVVWR